MSSRNASYQFQKNARYVIDKWAGLCNICGHYGAITIDHVISVRDWPLDELGNLMPGCDDIENLRPAHGTRGLSDPNPCLECDRTKWPRGRLCNQSKGAGTPGTQSQEVHSRNW